MADLQGSLPTNDTDQDDATPDVVDTGLLQERVNGDEAFVERLQETLRPLYVLTCMHTT